MAICALHLVYGWRRLFIMCRMCSSGAVEGHVNPRCGVGWVLLISGRRVCVTGGQKDSDIATSALTCPHFTAHQTPMHVLMRPFFMHYALLIWFIVPLGPVRVRTRRRFVINLKIHACLNCPIPRNLSFIATTYGRIVAALRKIASVKGPPTSIPPNKFRQ